MTIDKKLQAGYVHAVVMSRLRKAPVNITNYIPVMEFIEGKPLSRVHIDETIVDQVFATLKVSTIEGIKVIAG